MLGENEIWKDIEGYEGMFQVSNTGRVRRLKKWNSGRRCLVDDVSLVAQTDNGNGYLIVSLCKNKKRKNFYVHRLVATYFVDNPRSVKVVNHLDLNKKNNYYKNLEWCTCQENVLYSVDLMRKPRTKPTTNTGEMYITKQKQDGRFRVIIFHKEYGRYKTLEEAIAKRNSVLKEVNPECLNRLLATKENAMCVERQMI